MPSERTRYYQTRPRRVPPEFCTDEFLESCTVLATLLLYRLISQADDQGRLPGHPKYVKATCVPMRPDVSERKVAAALDELVGAGFLIRYDYKGRVLLQVDRWFDLQGKWGQRRTYPSRYPAPPGWTHDWVNAGAGDDEVRAPGGQDAREARPPVTLPSPTSPAPPPPGPGERRSADAGLERIGELIDKARRGGLTHDEAFELGASMVGDAQTSTTSDSDYESATSPGYR